MSHQPAWVRFSDGVVKFAEYDGTSDQILTPIYDDVRSCRAAWRSGATSSCTCGGDEPAEYVESYGQGGHGPIRACRHCNAITETTAFDPTDEGYASSPSVGLPPWAPCNDAVSAAR